MPSDVETLIREVLTAQADRAPHRATVLAGLRWGRTRRPHRRLAMAAAGVAVALAMIGVPIGLHPTGGPAPAASQPVLKAQPPDFPLLFHATWLPAGYVMSMRGVQGSQLTERWEPRGSVQQETGTHIGNANIQSGSPFLQLDYTPVDVQQVTGKGGTQPVGQPTDINGQAGILNTNVSQENNVPGLHEATVTWAPRPDALLVMTAVNVTDLTDVVVLVARSVVAGGTDVIAQPLTFGWLPLGYRPDDLQIYGTSPADWVVTQLTTGTAGNHPWIIASCSLNRQGVPPQLDQKTAVDIPTDGGWLTVSSPGVLDTGSLKRIALGITVFPDVRFPWLGR